MKLKRFLLPIFTVAFLVLLTFFAVTEGYEYTEAELADEIDRLIRLENYDLSTLDEEGLREVERRTEETQHAIDALPAREGVYITSMAIICGFYLVAVVWMYIGKVRFSSLVSAVCILLGIGTTYRSLFLLESSYTVMLCIAIAACIAVYVVWRRFPEASDVLYYVIVGAVGALLLANLIFGTEINGARLWIYIGSFSLQPGEFVKLLLILLGALSYRNMRRALIYCATAMVSCATLLLLHDLGNTAAIFLTFIFVTYFLFDSKKLSGSIIAAAATALSVAVAILPYAQDRFAAWGKAMTPEGSVQQADTIKAVIFGGVGGFGFDFETVSTYVTSKYASASDTAIAGIMATFGIPVMALVILAYGAVVIQPAQNRAVHPSSHIILIQISVLTTAQVLLNFLGSMDLLPFTGIVAPLISEGGSALIAFMSMMGLAGAAICPALKPKKE